MLQFRWPPPDVAWRERAVQWGPMHHGLWSHGDPFPSGNSQTLRWLAVTNNKTDRRTDGQTDLPDVNVKKGWNLFLVLPPWFIRPPPPPPLLVDPFICPPVLYILLYISTCLNLLRPFEFLPILPLSGVHPGPHPVQRNIPMSRLSLSSSFIPYFTLLSSTSGLLCSVHPFLSSWPILSSVHSLLITFAIKGSIWEYFKFCDTFSAVLWLWEDRNDFACKVFCSKLIKSKYITTVPVTVILKCKNCNLIGYHNELLYVITVRKRKLQEGTVFTPVCDSVHRGRVSVWGVSVWGSLSTESLSGGVSVQRGSLSGGSLSRGVLCLGGLCPGGSLTRGVSVWGGLCWGGLSPYGKERAVHILLQCILVLNCTKLADRARHLECSVVWKWNSEHFYTILFSQ